MMQRVSYLLVIFAVACGQPIPTADDFDPPDVQAPLDTQTADADATLDAEVGADTQDTVTLDADAGLPKDVTVQTDAQADADATVAADADVTETVDVATDAAADAVDVVETDIVTDDADATGAADAAAGDADAVDADAVDAADVPVVDKCGGIACSPLPCATNVCDPATGKCVSTPLADGSACLNGSGPCMECQATACLPKASTACDDGLTCTTNDACVLGSCAGTGVNCDDGNPCTSDSCVETTGCAHVPVALPTPCDDGKICTTNDACVGATCTGDTSKCQNTCATDADCPGSACNTSTHICFGCTNDAGCPGGQYCVNHTCGATLPCTLPGASCTSANLAICDAGSGSCVQCLTDDQCPSQPPIPGFCVDNACRSKDELCATGFLECPSGKKCAMIPATSSPIPIGICGECANDGECASDHFCRYGVCAPDLCVLGDSSCKSNTPLTCNISGSGYLIGGCDDGNVCTSDSCNASGCVFTPVASTGAIAQCPIDSCTTGTCDASGGCSLPTPTNCDDGFACSVDGCDPKTGCTHASTLFAQNYGDVYTDELRRVAPQKDGTFVVGGTKQFTGNNANEYWVAKIGATGALTWEASGGGFGDQLLGDFGVVPGITPGFALVITGDMVGDGTMGTALVRLDANGAESWRKIFGSSGATDKLHALLVLRDGFLVAGTTIAAGSAVGWAIRTDIKGNKLWEQTYGTKGLANVNAIAMDSTGIFLVGSSNATPAQALVVRADLNGNELWGQSLGSSSADASAIALTADGAVVVSTQPGMGTPGAAAANLRATRLLRTSGKIVWDVTTNHVQGSHAVYSAASLTGGTVIGGSVLGDDGVTRAQIQFISDKGALGWSQIVDGYEASQFFGVAATANAVIAVGQVTLAGGYNPDGLLSTFDHFGNKSCALSGSCFTAAGTICDDGNPCTADVCSLSGICQFAPFPDGANCDDGLVCTVQDSCLGGKCLGGTKNNYCREPCIADSQCLSNSCDLATLTCNECTDGTQCASGVCAKGKCFVDLDCTTQDCVVGSCVSGKCQACAAGSVCPSGPCVDGQCTSTTFKSCTTDASCNAGQKCLVGKCMECLMDNDCGPNRYCSPWHVCEHSVCATAKCSGTMALSCIGSGYAVVSCDDGNACTTDRCDPANGACIHEFLASGASCSDGSACNASTCDGGGSCISGQKVCPQNGVCDPATGVCTPGVPASWGKCAAANQSCFSNCAQTTCAAAASACVGNPGCISLGDCTSTCQMTGQLPGVINPISAQEFSEPDFGYCYRQCVANVGPNATWAFMNTQLCETGECMDCAADGGANYAQCEQACGFMHFCSDVINACASNAECLGLMTCAFACSTPECANACDVGASPSARTLHKAVTDCTDVNNGGCIKGP